MKPYFITPDMIIQLGVDYIQLEKKIKIARIKLGQLGFSYQRIATFLDCIGSFEYAGMTLKKYLSTQNITRPAKSFFLNIYPLLNDDVKNIVTPTPVRPMNKDELEKYRKEYYFKRKSTVDKLKTKAEREEIARLKKEELEKRASEKKIKREKNALERERILARKQKIENERNERNIIRGEKQKNRILDTRLSLSIYSDIEKAELKEIISDIIKVTGRIGCFNVRKCDIKKYIEKKKLTDEEAVKVFEVFKIMKMKVYKAFPKKEIKVKKNIDVVDINAILQKNHIEPHHKPEPKQKPEPAPECLHILPIKRVAKIDNPIDSPFSNFKDVVVSPCINCQLECVPQSCMSLNTYVMS